MDENDESHKENNDQEQTLIEIIKIKSSEFWEATKKTTKNYFAWSKKNTISFGRWLDKVNTIQILIALSVSILGIYLSTRVFDMTDNRIVWLYVLIGLGVILGIATWVFVATRYLGKMIYYVVEHKWLRKVFAGGSFSYFEYQNQEDYKLINRFTEPFGVMITTFIAFLGLATTGIGIVKIFSENVDIISPILWGVLAIIGPIIGTLILPIAWNLTDLRVKGWNEKNQTTWMVSSKYKRRFNGFITIGAIVSNLRSNSGVSALGEQIEALIAILRVGAVVVFISVGFFVIFYFVWYRTYLRKLAVQNLKLKSYEVVLKEHDVRDSHVFKYVEVDDKEIESTEDKEEDEMSDEESNDPTYLDPEGVDQSQENIETVEENIEREDSSPNDSDIETEQTKVDETELDTSNDRSGNE